jgi:hypothetical protein
MKSLIYSGRGFLDKCQKTITQAQKLKVIFPIIVTGCF